jgi:hypothetical protein
MYEEFLSILHYLQIPVYVAEGEADPRIVNMAREHDAYIITDDSDYHLYKFDRGYVPLSYFSFDKLEGRLYHMADIFQWMNQEGVALWAIVMTFDFIKFDDLDVSLNFSSEI